MKRYDTIIIGGGHNGLTAAFYLASAGLTPLVLERRDVVGGAAITGELHPGFRCPTLAHATGPLHPDVIRDMQLRRHGVQMIEPDLRLFAPLPDGGALRLYEQAERSAEEIAKLSTRDAERYREFDTVLRQLAELVADALWRTPLSLDSPTANDVWHLLKTGRRFHALGKSNGFRLLRWLPMPVADLVTEWFETDIVRAVIAARGIYGTFFGPRSAGSGAALLLQAALNGHVTPTATSARGGMGAITQAMAVAVKAAGGDVRTGADVARVTIKDGTAAGVVLADGEEIPAGTVVSNADPKHTLLRLVGPGELDPGFVAKIQHYRTAGTLAKMNIALDGLPRFTALKSATTTESAAALSGRIHIGPDLDYLERAFDAAKYGRFSERPYLDITIPTLSDPALAPDGRHVLSVCAQFAPHTLRDDDWKKQRDALGDVIVKALAEYAPNITGLILHRQVITPSDLEATYGLTGGHIFHGEHALDQLFTMRPLLGWAQYRTPINGLYLCGAGTHPGGGVTGACGMNASREILKDRGK